MFLTVSDSTICLRTPFSLSLFNSIATLYVCACIIVDPTTKDQQGNDVGTQYGSWVFCGDDEQLAISEKVKAELQKAVDSGAVKYLGSTVETQIGQANEFYEAHEEHQEYLFKNPLGYCNHRFRFREWPALN